MSDETSSREEKLASLDEFLGMAKVQHAILLESLITIGGPSKGIV